MLRIFPVVVAASLVASAIASAQTATLDSLDVQLLGRELIGIRHGSPATRIRLKDREEVQWMDAKGAVGAVLTNRRFLAVSLNSSGWKEQSLLLRRDGETPETKLAANLVLCITKGRILAFLGLSGLIIEESLSPGELVVDSGVNEHMGAVVTTRRVIGFSSGYAEPAEFRLRVNESLESLRVLATTATVRTPQRLLIYRLDSNSWRVEED